VCVWRAARTYGRQLVLQGPRAPGPHGAR